VAVENGVGKSGGDPARVREREKEWPRRTALVRLEEIQCERESVAEEKKIICNGVGMVRK
jgi:hypothetical protein